MPWCEECAKYYTPNSLEADGSCPKCGDVLQLADNIDEADEESTPWHFKLMVVAVVSYLAWRLVDLFV